MLTQIKGGHVIDPANDRDGIGDVWIEDGRVVEPPVSRRRADEVHDAKGAYVLAGGIDIHSHIAGANVNTSRLLLPELQGTEAGAAVPVAETIGRLYTAMGFTTVVEPAVSPHSAMQAQLELAEIPLIDTAILTVIGNDDMLLDLLRRGESANAIADYVGRTLAASRGLGVKVINPGAANALKDNVRTFGLDDTVPRYGVTSRAIIEATLRAVEALGVPHPLHLHCSNLGIPGNVETALATIEAAGEHRLHLAHLQFYAYGTEGKRGFSSAAPRLAEAVNARANITADVGQVMFGQTVTVSSDVLRQFGSRGQASPRKWSIMDGDGNGGGIIPYRYKRTSLYNAVQWAAGLELFLLIEDPSRIFFTTDHPNGAPFTAYPDVFALLMSRDLRAQWLETLPKAAREVTTLGSITREYTMQEIALMTRAAPSKLLGLAGRGHLAPGAAADIAVYRRGQDLAAMFRHASLVFKDGLLVSRDGEIVEVRPGRALALAPDFDHAIERRIERYYDDIYGVPARAFDVSDAAFGDAARFEAVPCAA